MVFHLSVCGRRYPLSGHLGWLDRVLKRFFRRTYEQSSMSFLWGFTNSKVWVRYESETFTILLMKRWLIIYYLTAKIIWFYSLCNRFQKRLALYIAAAHGHIEMASWLLDNGVQAHEPVGVHPSRVWCYETDHPESLKCPVHAAVEAGQLLILKMFLSRNMLNLACRDPSNQNLLQIAIYHQHKNCVSHLVSKLYTMVTFRGFALSTWIYVQIKIWINKAKRGLLKKSVLVNRGPLRSRVGDTLLIDGFSLSRMSSVPRGSVFKGSTWVKKSSCEFHALTSQLTGSSCPCHHPAVLSSQNASEGLPQLLPLAPNKRTGEKIKGNNGCGRKKPEEILVAENTDHKLNEWSSRVPLRHTFRDTGPRPLFIHSNPKSGKILCSSLESFTRCCGRTPRENAIYCLAIARSVMQLVLYHQINIYQHDTNQFCWMGILLIQKVPKSINTMC